MLVEDDESLDGDDGVLEELDDVAGGGGVLQAADNNSIPITVSVYKVFLIRSGWRMSFRLFIKYITYTNIGGFYRFTILKTGPESR